MKHVTKIVMYLFFGILWSQENPTIMRGGYDKGLKREDEAFQKNVAAHVKKWHGADQWNQYGWRVETGPRTGQYLIATFNHYWKDFDDRVTTKEHDKDWARITNSYIDNNNNKSIDTRIFSISFFQFFFVMVSFLGLIFSFVNSDFSNETVFNNSHTTKPLFYKISGTWGNHEGSLLLWLLVLTFFIFLFLIKSNKQPKKYRILTLFFQQIIIIGFFLFLLKNPVFHLREIEDNLI